MNRLRAHRRGQVIVLFTGGLVVLIGILALAVDVGLLWTERRHMQTAADAAAVAAAAALTAGDALGAIQTAGYNAATLNSFTTSPGTYSGANPITVTINNPPSAGVYAGNANYVEAIVTQPEQTFFLRALGRTTVTVTTRAVSGAISGPACMYALDPVDAKAFTVSGGTSKVTSTCGLLVKSTSTDGLDVSGGAIVSTGSIGVVGNYVNSSSTVTPTPITGIAPFPDPLAYLDSKTPAIGACSANTGSAGSKGHGYTSTGGDTIGPGVYCGGIIVSGGKTLHLTAGTYVLLGGGLQVSSSNLTGTGVTFFNTVWHTGDPAADNLGNSAQYKPVVFSGGATTSLTAPNSGVYQGILFFQDPALPSGDLNQQNTISGTSTAFFAGALYFPTTPLVFSGGSSVNPESAILVGYKITISGGTFLSSNYNQIAGSPIKSDTLYE